MKERPILFKSDMVQAILEGRKTMTRRIVKQEIPLPSGSYPAKWRYMYWAGSPFNSDAKKDPPRHELIDGFGKCITLKCPYGKLGNVLWVRETFMVTQYWMDNRCVEIKFADNEIRIVDLNNDEWHKFYNWNKTCGKKPSLFMFKSMSRLRLLIKSIRVERLQDITEADSIMEGSLPAGASVIGSRREVIGLFEEIWKKINGPESWEANPWVWCITFEKI